MKFSVEKIPDGVKVTLAADAKSKPVTVALTNVEVQIAILTLKAALAADRFKFEWEQ